MDVTLGAVHKGDMIPLDTSLSGTQYGEVECACSLPPIMNELSCPDLCPSALMSLRSVTAIAGNPVFHIQTSLIAVVMFVRLFLFHLLRKHQKISLFFPPSFPRRHNCMHAGEKFL